MTSFKIALFGLLLLTLNRASKCDDSYGTELKRIEFPSDNIYSLISLRNDRLAARTGKFIAILDLKSQKWLRLFEGHNNTVNSLVDLGDDRIASSDSSSLLIWNSTNFEIIKNFSQIKHSLSLAALSDERIAIAHDKMVQIRHISNGSLIHNMTGHTDIVLSLARLVDNRLASIAYRDNTVLIWDTENGNLIETLIIRHNYLSGIKYLYSFGNILASSANYRSIQIWDLKNYEEIVKYDTVTILFKYYTVYNCLTALPNEKLATGSVDGKVQIWNAINATLIYDLTGHTEKVNILCLLKDNITLLSYSSDKTIRLWNINSGKSEKIIKESPIKALVVLPNQDLGSATAENKIRIWEKNSGQLIKILHGHNKTINCLVALNNRLFSGSDDMTIKIWNTRTGSLESTLKCTSEIKSLAFLTNNQLASGLSDGTIQIWNITNSELVKILKQNSNSSIDSLVELPDKSLVAARYRSDRTIFIWNVKNEIIIQKLNEFAWGRLSLALLEEGLLISVCKFQMNLWNTTNGDKLNGKYIGGKNRNDDTIITALPDRRLAVGFSTGEITIIMANNGKVIRSWIPQKYAITAFAVFANSTLASGSEDGKIILWNTRNDQCGGLNYKGPTECSEDKECFEKSVYFSQCDRRCPPNWLCQGFFYY